MRRASDWIFVKAGIDPYLCLLIVVPLAFLVGIGLFYGLFRKAAALEDKNVSLLIAVGLMYLIENAILKVWSANPRGLNISYSDATIVGWGLRVAWLRVALLGLAVLSALVVYLFLKKTRLGTAVRAASEDMEATTLQGINSTWVCAVSFAVGIGLAGVAGVGMATVYSFDYQFGFAFAIKALIALSLGGIGNVFGALAGGLILGVIENLTAAAVKMGYSKELGRTAAMAGLKALEEFRARQAETGKRVLAELKQSGKLGVVIFARAYMGQDSGANLGIAEKLEVALAARGHHVPVIEPPAAAVKMAEALSDLGLAQSKLTYPAPPHKSLAGYEEMEI